MLSLESLKNFYFLPDLYDMRCGAQRILETIKIVYGRYPYGGDVFIFMSKNRRRLKMVQFENNAFYIHEKVFKRGYRFMRLEVDGGGNPIYSISWNDLVTLLECPVIDVLRVRSQILAESTQQSDNKKNII